MLDIEYSVIKSYVINSFDCILPGGVLFSLLVAKATHSNPDAKVKYSC